MLETPAELTSWGSTLAGMCCLYNETAIKYYKRFPNSIKEKESEYYLLLKRPRKHSWRKAQQHNTHREIPLLKLPLNGEMNLPSHKICSVNGDTM